MNAGFRQIRRRYTAVILTAAFVLLSAADVRSQNSETGEKPFSVCWIREIPNGFVASPVSYGGLVILAERGGRLSAIDEEDGQPIWSTELGGEIGSNLINVGDTVYVVSISTESKSKNGLLRLVDARTGLVRSSVATGSDAPQTIASSGKSIFLFSSSGKIQSFSPDLKRSEWFAELGSPASTPPAFGQSVAVVVTLDRRLSVVNLDNGNFTGQINWDHKITSVAVLNNGSIVFGDERGQIVQLGGAAANVGWKYKTGGAVTHISVDSTSVIAASNDNFLYRFDIGDGSVLWRKRLTGRAAHSPIVFGQSVVTASIGDSSIPVVSNATGNPLNRIQLGDERYLTFEPIVTDAGRYVFLYGISISAFSQDSCEQK